MDQYQTSGGNSFINPEAFHLDVKIVAVDCITKLPDNFFCTYQVYYQHGRK